MSEQERVALMEYSRPSNWAADDNGVRRVWLEPDSSTPYSYNGYELASVALASPTPDSSGEGEAVAWQERQKKRDGWSDWYDAKAATAMGKGPGLSEVIGGIEYQWRPLYTRPTPPAQQAGEAPHPVGSALSDEQIEALALEHDGVLWQTPMGGQWRFSTESLNCFARAAVSQSQPPAPATLLMQDENSGRDGRRYNEWHASRPDARLNAREAAAALANVPPAATQAVSEPTSGERDL